MRIVKHTGKESEELEPWRAQKKTRSVEDDQDYKLKE